MKRSLSVFGVLVLLLAVTMPALGATWGDFEIVPGMLDTNVDFFVPPDTPSNPPPFAPPSTIEQGNTYPDINAAPVTVADYQNYLAGAGFPNNTFGIEVTLKPFSSVFFNSMVITIGGNAAALSNGNQSFTNATASEQKYYLLPQLNLGSYAGTDKVLISYNTINGFSNMSSISMAATPEPISMAFLSTGLLGMVLARVRRRRR